MEHVKLKEIKSSGIDFLNIAISREEVLNNDFTNPLETLSQLTSDITFIEYFRERVDISFEGYNGTSVELWEIPEVRNYVAELDSKFPFWLYFLSKNGEGLYIIIKPEICISNSIAASNCFKISHYVAVFDFTIAVLCLSLQTA
jgi:hypothetical protein